MATAQGRSVLYLGFEQIGHRFSQMPARLRRSGGNIDNKVLLPTLYHLLTTFGCSFAIYFYKRQKYNSNNKEANQ